MHKPLGILASSTDPEQLSASVTGAIVMFASLIVLLAGHLGFPITVEQVSTYAGALGSAIGAIWGLFGLTRKAVIAIHDRM